MDILWIFFQVITLWPRYICRTNDVGWCVGPSCVMQIYHTWWDFVWYRHEWRSASLLLITSSKQVRMSNAILLLQHETDYLYVKDWCCLMRRFSLMIWSRVIVIKSIHCHWPGPDQSSLLPGRKGASPMIDCPKHCKTNCATFAPNAASLSAMIGSTFRSPIPRFLFFIFISKGRDQFSDVFSNIFYLLLFFIGLFTRWWLLPCVVFLRPRWWGGSWLELRPSCTYQSMPSFRYWLILVEFVDNFFLYFIFGHSVLILHVLVQSGREQVQPFRWRWRWRRDHLHQPKSKGHSLSFSLSPSLCLSYFIVVPASSLWYI